MKQALSQNEGPADQPGDFRWMAESVPCQAACPAATDIPGYLAAIARGDPAEAYRINLRDNVFPAVLGRVCSRPCEPPCRHGWEGLGEPVAICFSKRSADDGMHRTGPVILPPVFPASGRSVAVVGAGAAGLAVARDLALWGHRVTVYEKHDRPGGMMVQGIPRFRLPRPVVEREIEQVLAQGVQLITGTTVGPDLPLEHLLESHDAVIIAAGTLRPNIPSLPGHTLAGVEHGLSFLLDVHASGRRSTGRRVVVIGGGFTAVDCARTARRLGAREVGIYYRRSVREMYIMTEELDQMAEEKIPLATRVSPVAIVGHDGRAAAVRFVRTRIEGEGGKDGQRIVPIDGSEFEIPADAVILATGQSADHAWIDDALKTAVPSGSEGTGIDRLFAAGDFVHGPSTLIEAIGHARRCARTVDAYLMGGPRLRDAVRIEPGREQARTRAMDRIPRQHPRVLRSARRSLEAEVEQGFDSAASVREARRCYLCHYAYEIEMDRCIYCDQCMQVKPRARCIERILKSGTADAADPATPRPYDHRLDTNAQFDYVINHKECIRCDACLRVCPVQCITVRKASLCSMPEPAGT